MKRVERNLENRELGDFRSLARAISLVENEGEGYYQFLQNLKIDYSIPIIGITGPPGAGKSTLLNALLSLLAKDKKIAIIAIDPTSPFSHGSLLGDRLRMSDYFLNPNIFIRSLATRGSLGGLSSRVFEITDVCRASQFDYVFVETVGVGQSEVEVAFLADTTVLVLNPGAGDEVQALKSGVLEVADIFVINKSDRAEADVLHQHLTGMLHLRTASDWTPPIIKTVATENNGIPELIRAMDQHGNFVLANRHESLFYEKAYRMIRDNKMKGFDKEKLRSDLSTQVKLPDFNFYRFLHENYF